MSVIVTASMSLTFKDDEIENHRRSRDLPASATKEQVAEYMASSIMTDKILRGDIGSSTFKYEGKNVTEHNHDSPDNG